VKFSVVPESSERLTAEMGTSGRSTPSFCAAMAGSSQVVIPPLKICATVPASSFSSEMPGRLNATLMGET
jgi:hypothetical protein